jgi:hypothetical protein
VEAGEPGDDVYKVVDPNSGNALEIQGCSKLPRATVFKPQ